MKNKISVILRNLVLALALALRASGPQAPGPFGPSRPLGPEGPVCGGSVFNNMSRIITASNFINIGSIIVAHNIGSNIKFNIIAHNIVVPIIIDNIVDINFSNNAINNNFNIVIDNIGRNIIDNNFSIIIATNNSAINNSATIIGTNSACTIVHYSAHALMSAMHSCAPHTRCVAPCACTSASALCALMCTRFSTQTFVHPTSWCTMRCLLVAHLTSR